MAEPEQGTTHAPTEPVEFANATADQIAVEAESSEEAYASESASDYTSVTSSVTNYQYQNGRRYHAFSEGKYVYDTLDNVCIVSDPVSRMPNDEDEQDRLDLLHHIFLLLLQGDLYIAPIPKSPQAILDLGTGTGIWALDMADKFPSARVIGNDLSPIQPKWIAPNLEFYVDDFEEEWSHKPESFDYIHGRTLAGSVKDWPALLAQAYKCTKKGGYVEFQESAVWAWSDDGTLKDDSPYMQYLRYISDASKRTGRELNVAHKIKDWMTEAGFEDVTDKIYILPFRSWPKDPYLKELGKYQFYQASRAIEAYSLALFTRILGWSEEKARIFIAIVCEQVKGKDLHAYVRVHFTYGRRPE